MFKNVLVLCLGNICRSPIAAVLLREHIHQRGLNLTVDSAGLTAMVGWQANPISVELMQARHLSLTCHVAKQITADHVLKADLILVMDDTQRQMLEQQFHHACGKTFRLGHHGDFDIEDPYQKERRAFEDCTVKIERGVIEWLDFIAGL